MQQIETKQILEGHDWVRKMIHWELCMRLLFDHADKWYMQKPEFILEDS